MKNIFFALLALLFSTASAFAKATPPKAVLTAFEQKFPAAKDHVKWAKESNGDWEAEFDLAGKELSANFSAAGKWLETETEIKTSELPQAVRTALKGKKIRESARIEKADGSVVFEAEVKKKDWLFDASGKRLN